MNEFFNFSKLDPYAIGFGDIFEDFNKMSKNVSKLASYPPYNIKQVSDNTYVIEMAVAGFGKSDIEVTLEGNRLVVKGDAKDSGTDNYIYKGIAQRGFSREFKLADKVEIDNAELVNGMLKIWLQNMVKTQDLIKKINVTAKD